MKDKIFLDRVAKLAQAIGGEKRFLSEARLRLLKAMQNSVQGGEQERLKEVIFKYETRICALREALDIVRGAIG